jgi:hypothetical protein
MCRIILVAGLVTLSVSCVTPNTSQPRTVENTERSEAARHTAEKTVSFDTVDFWTYADQGESITIIAEGATETIEPIVVSQIQAILSQAGFTIVERRSEDLLLEELLRQLEPPYETGTDLRLGAWLQSNLLAVVTVQLRRTAPAVTPRDTRNLYYSPRSAIAVYDLSTRRKILSIEVYDFQTTGQMTESAAASAVLEHMEIEFVRR